MTSADDTHELSDELQARKDLATIKEAEAVADKADADARKLDAEATKQAMDAAEHSGPTARAKREAVERKETAEANKDAAAARADQIKALIPDLSKVTPSTLEVGQGPAFATSPLAYRALQKAAAAVNQQMALAVKGKRILVTSDEDLATGDATYWDVSTGLKELVRSADVVLTELETAKAAKVETASFVPGLDAITAVAAAIPSVLSLFSAERSTASAAVTIEDITAAAAVTGALTAVTDANKPESVVHDDFRLLPGPTNPNPARGSVPEGIYDLSASIDHRRGELRTERIIVVHRKADNDESLATNTSAVAAAQKSFDEANDADKEVLGKGLDDLGKARAGLLSKAAKEEARIAGIDAVITGLDSFTTAIRTIPAGAKRSPLATAALHEQLHTGEQRFDVVLLVRAEAGQTQQVVTNKPLWFRDRFATVVDVGITYMLISTNGSSILAAGTAPGTATATGKLGDAITINIDGTPAPAPIQITAAPAPALPPEPAPGPAPRPDPG